MFKSLPKVLKRIFNACTLEDIDILNRNFIGEGIDLNFEAVDVLFFTNRFLRIRIQ